MRSSTDARSPVAIRTRMCADNAITRARPRFDVPPSQEPPSAAALCGPPRIEQLTRTLSGREDVARGQGQSNRHGQHIGRCLVVSSRAGEVALNGLVDPSLPQENSSQRGLGARALVTDEDPGEKRRSTERFGGSQLTGIGACRRLPDPARSARAPRP